MYASADSDSLVGQGADFHKLPPNLTTKQMADWLGVDVRHLNRMREQNCAPPSFKTGRGARAEYRYPKHLLIRWVEEQCSAPTPGHIAPMPLVPTKRGRGRPKKAVIIERRMQLEDHSGLQA